MKTMPIDDVIVELADAYEDKLLEMSPEELAEEWKVVIGKDAEAVWIGNDDVVIEVAEDET